ncbi:VOC family protein [Xylanimonas sp. McL0601]|uniref:VOC family protein n=1 Tax=Xylanimonas sp. McL0601 TaxID=3414739 RepID=UPI003CF4F2DD
MTSTRPTIVQVVLDTTDVRGLAEFYRQLFGLEYRDGDEPPASADQDDKDWLVLRNPGGIQLAFQEVDDLPLSTWPTADVPQQLHLDTTVPDVVTLDEQTKRALDLGAVLLFDRSDDEEEPLRVFGDPAGHPFCIFVA